MAINAVAGITDYQQTRSDRLTFCPEKPRTPVLIVCDPLIINQGVVERAGEKPLGVKYVKHQVQSVSTHVINEHVFQPKQKKT